MTPEFRKQKGWLRPLAHIRGALALLATLTLIGTAGFSLIEGWSLFDSLYMSVITLGTQGYSETHPLSVPGRVFTIFLIIAGVMAVGYSVAVITRAVIEGEMRRAHGVRRMEKKISQFQNHTVVCGYGRLAHQLVKELLSQNKQLVVIDTSPDKVQQLRDANIPVVHGSAYEDDILKAAGIERAGCILTLLPKDSDNVYVTLCARDLNPSIAIVARSEGDMGEKKLRRAGATHVIAPYRVAGAQLAQLLIRPHVSAFLELVSTKNDLAIEEVQVPNNSPVAGLTLGSAELRAKTGAFIAAMISPDGSTHYSPEADTVLEKGSTLVAIGHPQSLRQLAGLLDA